MKDQSKTKQVLIQELAILRQRVEELEQSQSEWKKEKGELKKSESLFRSYFDLPLYGIAITSPEKGWIAVNNRICSIMGYSRNEILCKTWSEMTHPDDLATDTEQFNHILGGKIDQYNMCKRFIRKDGEVIWTNLSVGCVRNPDHSVDHIVAMIEDITSVKLAEETLRQERMLYEDLVTTEPAGVYRLRVKLSGNWQTEPWRSIVKSMYSVDMASDRYCNILGISHEAFMTNAALVRDLIHPDDKQDFDALNMEAITRLCPFTWEGRIIRDHQTRWMHFESLPRVLDSETVLWTGIVYDITERKQIVDALQKSEVKYRRLHQSMMDAFVSTDMEGYIKDYNESYLNMLGYAPEEIITLTYKDITPEKWHTMEGAIVERQVLTKGYSDIYEKEYRRKDGTTFPVELRSMLLRDTDGTPVSMWAIVRDITERKKAEEELKESEIRFRELFNNMSSGVAVYEAKNDGTDFIFKDINKTSMRINGKKQEEVVGRFVTEVFPGIREMGLLDVFRRVWKTGVAEHQAAVEYKDARLHRWYENRVYKLPSGEIVAVHDDVTERKEAENELKRSVDEISDLYNNAPCGYHSLDAEGTFIRINDTQLRWLGYARDELVGKKRFPDILTPGGQESFKSNYPLLKRQGWLKDAEYELLRKDGSILPVILNATAIKNEEGVFLLSRASLFDNTERKRTAEYQRELEERLQRAEKMEALGTLAGGVAHDLNNVLGIVVGYSEMLLDEIDESSPLRNEVMKIMEGGQRSAAIVQDLLTLARRGVSGRKVLNLNKLILDYKKSPEWEKLLSYHPSVQIRTYLEADLLNISAASVHLEKALFNLVSNACEAMTKGGCVTLRTTNQYLDKPMHGYDNIREGDYVVLSVSDTGEGVPESDLKRIFEPFYTKKIMGRSGTGLGLAVVWGTVKDHQGYINVESEEGKGSIFTIYFPAVREDITAESLSVSIHEYMGKGESILVVDDVKGQRELAAAMLKKLNYKVAIVSSGEDAVEYLRKHEIDLMVLDMIMDPGMDGLETYRNVLEIHPKQKAIILSGFSESDQVHDAQALGAGAYVRKPYVIEKLGLAVREELDRK
jgi:PAS domain S-box-containing protein